MPVVQGVVLTLLWVPLTGQTRGMIDAAAIERMHSGAVLVNVGRGGVVDETALLAGKDRLSRILSECVVLIGAEERMR